jgi:hypothetical protein
MSKIQVTAQQRANAVEALEVMWPSVPPENVIRHLNHWREDAKGTPPTCGTVACFGGWCAWWPSFMNQGVKAASGGAPISPSQAAGQRHAEQFLFGDPEMFDPRGCHPADQRFKGSDHDLVTNRLKWLIESSEVVGG